MSTYTDAAGRLDVAVSESLGDYLLTRDSLPLYFDGEVVGTGAQAYDATTNSNSMTVATGGDAAIFQTRQAHPYFPGNAQQPEFTYINLAPEVDVVKRVGYFSSSTVSPFTASMDGIFLESANGSVDFVVMKEGAEVSRIKEENFKYAGNTAIDWTKFNVSMFDFLYLGGTAISLRQITDGGFQSCARYDHAGKVADVVIGSPSQPIRAEIRSTGGAGSMKFVCASVKTGGQISEQFGTPLAVDTDGAISASASGTEVALIGLRKNDPYAEFVPTSVDIGSSAGAGVLYRWRLLLNPTLSAGLSYSALSDDPFDVAIGTGETVSNPGKIISSGSGASRSSITSSISKALRIGRSISGVYDELVLAYTPYSTNHTAVGTLDGLYF